METTTDERKKITRNIMMQKVGNNPKAMKQYDEHVTRMEETQQLEERPMHETEWLTRTEEKDTGEDKPDCNGMQKERRQESKNKSNKTGRMKGRGTPAGCCHAHVVAHSKRLSACNFGLKKDTERSTAVFVV